MAKREMPVRKILPVVDSKLVEKKKLVVDLNEEVDDPVELQVANCELLNVREGPSKDTKILYKLSAGSRILVDAMNGEWFHIRSVVNNQIAEPGYVLGEFTDEV